ncbi:hypothetical protein P3342_004624 [Pyrenophora teres f. teres]|nr:hypothetical protein P3342_004624 [Pyrenophora teres f. teres]
MPDGITNIHTHTLDNVFVFLPTLAITTPAVASWPLARANRKTPNNNVTHLYIHHSRPQKEQVLPHSNDPCTQHHHTRTEPAQDSRNEFYDGVFFFISLADFRGSF